MTARALLVLTLCGLLLASTASVAADVAPLAMLKLVQIASLRLDRLQTRLDRLVFGSNVYAYAAVDAVSQTQPGVLAIAGWAFGCGYSDARVVMVVDDIEVGGLPARVARPDVNAAYASACNVVGDTGAVGLVDMAVFEPGWLGNHTHTVKFRVYPPTWPTVVPFAMAESAPVTLTTW